MKPACEALNKQPASSENSLKVFNNPIPSTYVSSKGLPIQMYFSIYELNSLDFTSRISKYLPVDFVYTVFIKVRYNVDEFFMAQFGFNYTSESDIKGLLDVVSSKLQDYMADYNLSDDAIVYIQISFRQKNKKLLSEFLLDKPSHIPDGQVGLVASELSIPLSINEDSLGKSLPVKILNGFITYIGIEIKMRSMKLVNFLYLILNNAKILRDKHKDKITCFDQSYKFYLLKDKYDYILAVKILGGYSIDKLRYSISGVLLSHVTDVAVNNVVLRK